MEQKKQIEPMPISRAEFIRMVREDCNKQLEYTPEQALLRVIQEKTVEKVRGQENQKERINENTHTAIRDYSKELSASSYNVRQASMEAMEAKKEERQKRGVPIYSAKDTFGNTPLDLSTYSEMRTPRRGSVRESLPLVSKEKIENIEQFPYERVRMEENDERKIYRDENIEKEIERGEDKKEHQVINFGSDQDLGSNLLTEQELKAKRNGSLMKQLRQHPKLRWFSIRTVLAVAVFSGIVVIDKLNIRNDYISGEQIQEYVSNNVTMEQLEEKVSWFVGEKVMPVFKGGK